MGVDRWFLQIKQEENGARQVSFVADFKYWTIGYSEEKDTPALPC